MRTHKVRDGETLTSIAKLYEVRICDILSENQIRNINFIRENQLLKIPKNRIKTSDPVSTGPAKSPKVKSSSNVKSDRLDFGDVILRREVAINKWLNSLLENLRVAEANERIQVERQAPLTRDTSPVSHTPTPPRSRRSRGSTNLDQVKANLKEKLNKEIHVIEFSGVKLTQNERKQIVAAVATCEMNDDGFGSINDDQEFVGRKYGKEGIGGLSYSRIVHIGLSYGLIQYTQDSGNIGKLLKLMRTKNEAKFVEIFGGGDTTIASSLITLTSTGRPDLASDNEVPLSGQAYWNSIRRSALGRELTALANGPTQSNLPISREIRGKRVQPIPANPGDRPTDLWTGVWKQRFLEAGSVLDFQEVQMEFAVKNFFNPFLRLARRNNVRSALALAMIAACNIRGGVGSDLSELFYRVATELNITLPFASGRDELKCVEAIAGARGNIGHVAVDHDESRRARLLMKDELGFLAEDLYDTSTYTV